MNTQVCQNIKKATDFNPLRLKKQKHFSFVIAPILFCWEVGRDCATEISVLYNQTSRVLYKSPISSCTTKQVSWSYVRPCHYWFYCSSVHPSRVYGICHHSHPDCISSITTLIFLPNPSEELKKATLCKAKQNISGLWSNGENNHAWLENPQIKKHDSEWHMTFLKYPFSFVSHFLQTWTKFARLKKKKKACKFPIRFTLEIGTLKNSCLITLSPY